MSDMTLAELLNTAKSLRADKRALETKVKETAQSLEEINQIIQRKMHAEGIEKTTVGGITVSLTKSTVYNITDYDSFAKYIVENSYTGLLQRRVSNPFMRELIQAGETVPGIEPFEKEQVNMRVS
jgi:hypothetical protein